MRIGLGLRLFAWFLVVSLASAGLIVVLGDRTVRAQASAQVGDRLTYEVTMLGQMTASALFGPIDPSDTALGASVKSLADAVHTNLSLLTADGTVVADSDLSDLTGLPKQFERPEIKGALASGTGQAVQNDGRGMRMYVAQTIVRDGIVLGIARASVPLSDVDSIAASVRGQMMLGSALGGAAAVFLAALVSLSILRPIRQLADGAKRVGEGHLDHRVVLSRNDQLGDLALTLNEMAGRLQTMVSRLDRRNRDMRIVLDTVAQGLVTVAKDGSLGDERSKAIDTWFGSPKAGVKIWDVFRDAHPNVRISLEIGIGQVFENTLPLALTLSQLPRRIEDGRVVYELAYEAVDAAAGTAPTSILVIVSDITARVHAERSEAEQREQMSIFAAVAKDRSGLIDFLRETGKLIAFVGEHFASDVRRVEVLRALHTIKGNSSLLGMTSVSWLCHSIETRLAEDGGTGSMRRADSEALESAWVALTRRAEELLGNVSSATIDVTAVDVAELVSAIQRDESREGLMRTLARWSMEPVAKRFTRLAEQGRQLAARIGKPGITVETRAEGVRLPSDRFAVFWTALSHVLRNALDHGIESPSQRIAAGKPEFGHLVLAASDSNGQVVIEVTDDGRGIDWPRLREMAVGLGLASSSERDLTDALFADGVSTRDEVSELSGRGVGLGAVRAACQQLDGHIVVESAIGMGTTMRFVFPAPGAPPPAPTRKVTVSVAPRANV